MNRNCALTILVVTITSLALVVRAPAQTTAAIVLTGPTANPATREVAEVAVVYSPWAKVCDKKTAQAVVKEVCLTISEAYLQSGQFFASAALVEAEGNQNKTLRVIMPLGVSLAQGSRLVIDKGEPTAQPFRVCFPNGCMSEYDVTNDLISKMRDSERLVIEAIDSGTQKPIYLVLPLDGFAQARDGASIAPATLEERQKKFRDQIETHNKGINSEKPK